MAHITARLGEASTRLCAVIGDRDVPEVAASLDDPDLLSMLSSVTDARKALDVIAAAASAEIDRRSVRELGGTGLAQRTGHRNATSLVQQITGQSRGDVQRSLAAGRDLAGASCPPIIEVDAEVPTLEPPTPPWYSPLAEALTSGRLSRDQFDAIRRGLGEPPVDRYPEFDPAFLPGAWREAALRLIEEAHDSAVEELRAAARLARDALDPIGVTLRFDERYANRSFRTWIDEHGQRHARIAFDDEAAAWVHAILAAALRPRRGPRFVRSDAAPEERDAARDSATAAAGDERTNEQLQYDTLVAILRTGANADPNQAFGDRQPGVRIVTTREHITRRDEFGNLVGIAHDEDTGLTLPSGVLEKYLCDAATLDVTVDSSGRPLDVGREKRLFTKKQRIGLRVRDGGCVWEGCGAPPSQCEAHHINHWWEHHGRTDVDDGVLLCMFHHLRLHNGRWRITRDADGYLLHPPPRPDGQPSGPPIRLRSKSVLRFEVAA